MRKFALININKSIYTQFFTFYAIKTLQKRSGNDWSANINDACWL